ncbi:MAG: efflux RND transporter periplasmic adaptor subunit [Planctomycetes bacterium]|nr:efflux RND transporter periplasmic adaptor subunit [Planctomycetota bacterium]
MAIAESTHTSQTGRKLLERAAELFAARGYDAVSVREIVEACGVTKPALYYHYGSKEGLARAVISDFFDEARKLREQALKQLVIRDALLGYARGKIRLAQERRNTLAFSFAIWFGRSSLRAIFEDCRERHESAFGEWAAYLRSGGLNEARAHRVLRAYWGLLMHHLILMLQCPKWTGDADVEAEEIVKTVFEGAMGAKAAIPAKKRRAGKALLVLLITAGIALIAGCGGGGGGAGAQAPKAPPPRNVVVSTLATEKLQVQLKLPGVTAPRETIELRAAASGEIIDLPFKEGQTIPKSASPYSVVDLEAEAKLAPEKKTLFTFARINDAEVQVLHAARKLAFDQAVRDQKRVLEYKDSTEQQRDRAKLDVDNAEIGLKQAQKMLRDTMVVSPHAGVLRKRLRQKGEYVNQGELIGIVDVLNPTVFSFDVPEAYISLIKHGDEFEIEFSALKEAGGALKRKGKVSLIDKVANAATHTFRVETEVDNADGRVLSGIFGTLMLTTYDKADALVVPLQAIKLEGEDEVAFVLMDGKAWRRKIKRGVMTGNRFEILEGLAAGDTVITVGAQSINDGDAVQVRTDPTETK